MARRPLGRKRPGMPQDGDDATPGEDGPMTGQLAATVAAGHAGSQGQAPELDPRGMPMPVGPMGVGSSHPAMTVMNADRSGNPAVRRGPGAAKHKTPHRSPFVLGGAFRRVK